ncbi:MAG: alpha/beta hydrolase [Aestuariivita sp.]|nr:alpha/beta hydrolase [Aestuariivita sp.]
MPKFTARDGISLYYSDEGAGFPILCLAGLTRESSDFDYVSPFLNDCRLIRMDYRGRGKSDWTNDIMTYSIPFEAEDVIALLDFLELERVAILGSSRGGLIGLWLGTRFKERILGIALNDIGPELEIAGLQKIMNYLGKNPNWKTFAEAAIEKPKEMPGFIGVPHERWLNEVKRLYSETNDGLQIKYDPRLRDATIEIAASQQPDLWSFFDAIIDLPLAIIRGENSDLLSSKTVHEMKRHDPDLIAAEVPDRGHIPFLDEPEALAAIRHWVGHMR